jgi:hypothetical protein
MSENGLTPLQEITAFCAGVATQPLGEGGEITPADLIARYCPGQASSTPTGGLHAGCCAWNGIRGYQEGYDWSEHLSESGWQDQPMIGEAPYSMWMVWPARPSDARHVLAHYLDGDLTVEVFTIHAALSDRLARLRETEPGC